MIDVEPLRRSILKEMLQAVGAYDPKPRRLVAAEDIRALSGAAIRAILANPELLPKLNAEPHKLSSDGAAIVAPNYYWVPIDSSTPRGATMLLINKYSGVLQKGQYSATEKFFDHWAPNPVFRKDTQ